jgi:hypothetical protein
MNRQSRLSVVVIEPPVVSIRDRKTQELLGQLKFMRKEKSRLAGSNVPRQSFIRQFGSLLKRNRESESLIEPVHSISSNNQVLQGKLRVLRSSYDLDLKGTDKLTANNGGKAA